MNAIRPFLSAVAAPVAAAILLNSALPAIAQASVIPTEEVAAQVLSAGEAQAARDSLLAVIARSDVQAQMRSLGISPDEAAARVKALSDEEAVAAARKLPDDPAGQDAAGAIIGAALVIFLVLLVTDLLGLTDVFPFTRSAR